MQRKEVLVLAAVAEGTMGVALSLVPSLVGRLLLGEELTGFAVILARVAGIALTALCIACWPGSPLIAMLAYVVVSALYLAYVGLAGVAGILLWPAVVAHVILAALLMRALTRSKESET
jgi:hypothetical protein